MHTLFFTFCYAISFVCLLTLSTPSLASNSELKHSVKDWLVYTQEKDGRLLCYMVTYPIHSTGNYSFRSDAYLMITHINAQTDEVNTTGGYKYKPRTQPRINIDGAKYRFGLTQGETAWMKTRKYDRIIIEKMKQGSRMKITGTSTKGTYSIDTYSLSGFTKAHRQMKELCKDSNFAL